MCILFMAIGGKTDRFRLILANNRDEFLERPTRRAQFLRDLDERILAPVDMGYIPPASTTGANEHSVSAFPHRFHGHGTWIGVTTNGRFAVLTNFREDPKETSAEALSRGYIVRDFLLGAQHLKEGAPEPTNGHSATNGRAAAVAGGPIVAEIEDLMTPEEYARWLEAHDRYNGYSVILGDLRSEVPDLWYFSNRDGVKPTRLGPDLPSDILASDPDSPDQGVVIGLSNATLFDTRWPKVTVGRAKFSEVVQPYVRGENVNGQGDGKSLPSAITKAEAQALEGDEAELVEKLFGVLSSTDVLPPPPHVAWDPEMAKGLASVCVENSAWRTGYATRTQTLIMVDKDLQATYIERDRNVKQAVREDKSTEEKCLWTAERIFRFQIE